MQNSTNPFLDFAGLFQPTGSQPVMEQAKVTSLRPFAVFCRGLPFSGADLRVNAELLRQPEESEEPPVKAGDDVLICTVNDWQTIFVICKVVTV